jgi:TIGR03009 family protein
MSGLMTAADIKQRFDVTLEKEEEFYVHLRILPRLEKDKQEFEKMTLVLYSSKLATRGWDYLPAVVVFSRNDGQEVEQWTFKEPKVNPPGVKKEHFVPEAPPKGWQVERRSPTVGPKVVRP